MGSGGRFIVHIMLTYMAGYKICCHQTSSQESKWPKCVGGQSSARTHSRTNGKRKGKERREGRRKGENGRERMGGKEIAEV